MASEKTKRYKGVALLLSGFATCIISFIIGSKVVPGKVMEKVKAKICISSKTDEFYQKWIGSLNRFSSAAVVKVTYWNLTNKQGFLYRGEKPAVKEVGPYIYRISTMKADVSFSSAENTVEYKQLRNSQFDPDATQAACPKCSETDKITIPNVGYIGLMLGAQGDRSIAMGFVPTAYATLIKTAINVSRLSPSKLHERFGNFSCPLLSKGNAAFPESWSPPGFAPWFALQNRTKASPLYGLLSKISRTGYNRTEMEALAGVITSPVLLGVTGNSTLTMLCRANPTISGCGFLLYASALQQLQRPHVGNNTAIIVAVLKRIQDLFCPSPSLCLILDPYTTAAITLYITDHLAKLAIHIATDSFDFGPLMTRTVKQISHGYLETNVKIPGIFPKGFPVKNFLPLDKAEDSSAKSSSKVYTCGHASLAFQIKEFNGSQYVDSKYYPKASASDRKVDGYTGTMFGTKTMTPCTKKQKAMKDTYKVFDSTLKLHYNIVRKGTEYIGPIYTHKFEADSKSLYKQNNITVFKDGLIDVSENYQGVPIMISMPHFLYADLALAKMLGTKPDESLYKTVLSIEPVSGIVFKARTLSQMNVVIPEITIQAPRQPPLNISYKQSHGSPSYSNVIPLVWLEIAYEASETTQASFSGVYTGIDAACACIIAGPLFGGAGLILGLVYVVKSFKNQVNSHVEMD